MYFVFNAYSLYYVVFNEYSLYYFVFNEYSSSNFDNFKFNLRIIGITNLCKEINQSCSQASIVLPETRSMNIV